MNVEQIKYIDGVAVYGDMVEIHCFEMDGKLLNYENAHNLALSFDKMFKENISKDYAVKFRYKIEDNKLIYEFFLEKWMQAEFPKDLSFSMEPIRITRKEEIKGIEINKVS